MKKGIYDSYSDAIAKFYPFDIENTMPNKLQTINLTFQVTDACNLQCTYCYQTNKNTHTMPLEIAKQFIDLLLENKKCKEYIDTEHSQAVILDFIGGEPLLEIQLIDDIIQYFIKRTIELNHPWQYNWRISMSSNGVLYFEPQVQNFIKKYFDRLSFNISLDGNKELHDSCRIFPDGSGSYDIALAGVRHYVDELHGIMGSKMTLAPNNIIHTYMAVKELIEQGYTEINLNCVFEKGWELKHATILYNQLTQLADYILSNDLEDKLYIALFQESFFHPKLLEDNVNWCGGNGYMLALDWKGDIFPCLRYMESSLGNQVEPIIIGNVKKGIMYNNNTKNLVNDLRKINRISQSTQECIECPIAEGCAWCQAYNYQDSGQLNHRATYICVMHKANALANCYYWNLKYWKHNENKRMKLWLSDQEALSIISEKELNFLKQLQYPII